MSLYDPENHQAMTLRRQRKVDLVANDIPPVDIYGEATGDLAVLGWGSTYGAIRTAVMRLQESGHKVSHIHLRHLNPFPKNLGETLLKFPKLLVPELNMGQLVRIIRAEFLIDALPMNKVEGKPFVPAEIESHILSILKETSDAN